MTTTTVYVGIILAWVAAGVGAAVYLGRAGHRNWLWYLIGAVLGVLFVPIALERARRGTRHLGSVGSGDASPAAGGRLTVLVGVDASAESRDALSDAVSVFGPMRPKLVLVSVVDHDAAETGDRETLDAARQMLEVHADRLATHMSRPAVELASGPPAQALIDMAERCRADVIAVGRRGSGLSERVLGSVADHLVHRSSRPVLLGGRGRG